VKRTLLVSTIGVLVLVLCAAGPSARAQDQSQQGQDQGQQSQDQSQQNQDQSQQQKKKKGGLLGGFKAITGQSSEQGQATASAGTKGVGEGAKIGDTPPTPADRQKVTQMENYSVPDKALKKFQADGHLVPQQ